MLLSTSKIKKDILLSFEGPRWLIEIVDASLRPDNVWPYVSLQRLDLKTDDNNNAILSIKLAPSLSFSSSLWVLEEIFDCLELSIHILNNLHP